LWAAERPVRRILASEKPMRIPRICLTLFLAAVCARLAFAQGVATGDLRITVKDPGGKLVTNAAVTVRDDAKAVERPAAGNGQGEYSALALPPGSYSVRVSAPGFSNATAQGVIITVGGSADLPVSLTVAGSAERVEVSAVAELIETTRTSTTDTVDQR